MSESLDLARLKWPDGGWSEHHGRLCGTDGSGLAPREYARSPIDALELLAEMVRALGRAAAWRHVIVQLWKVDTDHDLTTDRLALAVKSAWLEWKGGA